MWRIIGMNITQYGKTLGVNMENCRHEYEEMLHVTCYIYKV